MNIDPDQCRAGRALLGWSRETLGKSAGVTERTITDFERGARDPRTSTKQSLRDAFEGAGLDLIPENGGGAGAKWQHRGIKIGNKRIRPAVYNRPAGVPYTPRVVVYEEDPDGTTGRTLEWPEQKFHTREEAIRYALDAAAAQEAD